MSSYYTATTKPGAGERARSATTGDIIDSLELAFDAVEADVLARANFAGNYADLTGALDAGASVYYLNQYWNLLSDLADVTAKVPGTDPEWALDGDTSPITIPDWPITVVYAGDDISTVTYAKGTERYRQTFGYIGSDLTSIVYAYSSNSGGSYTNIGTEAYVYAGSNLTSTTWTEA